MIRVAFRYHCPELMLEELLERFFLVELKFGVIKELFAILVLVSYINDEFGVDHDSPQDENTTVFLNEGFLGGEGEGSEPILLCEGDHFGDVVFLNEEVGLFV